MHKKKRQSVGDFDDTLKTRGELKHIAHARLREPKIYWRLVLLGLLPIVVEVIFVAMSFVAGVTKGISLHHLDQVFNLSQEFNDGLGWTLLSGMVSGIFGQILLYVSLMVVRKHNFKLEVGAAVVQHLSWRYVLTYMIVNTLEGILMTVAGITAVILGVIAVAAFHDMLSLSIFAGIVAAILGVLLPVYISLGWSQVPYLIKEAIEADDNQKLLKVLGDSWRMMRGFKFDLLITYLSMFWWYLLVICTLGLAWIFFQPYYRLVLAGFHENVRRFDRQLQAVSF
ncbi:DUF975 family protein [Lacticaseibacillus hulanensis]|uniref:DUF975 family protein n=1 Tax=Lacticaseibacillus hulanensis TaxID=2493111 RepID=UPI000FD93261|nr:DUF975 family protein [Lacticaseibacillus hulanensis]